MGSDESGRKAAVLCAAAGAVALGGLATYYALKSRRKVGDGSFPEGKVSAEQMVQLLEEIVASQYEMKTLMDRLNVEIQQGDLSFPQICELVDNRKPRDLLVEKGISIKRFTSLLEEFSGNPTIRAKVVNLTQATADSTSGSSKVVITPEQAAALAQNFTVKDVVQIHEFMLDELHKIMQSKDGSLMAKYTSRVATISSQAYVGKLVKAKYNLTSEQLEALVTHYNTALGSDQRFFELGIEMREAVQNLVKHFSAAEA
ncbi:unnamed protein product [Amoebophrya sp. A25]|nr:unnamed protein product [Amoebophrya sp. A25]|eukprot:GSA25T00019256001.1